MAEKVMLYFLRMPPGSCYCKGDIVAEDMDPRVRRWLDGGYAVEAVRTGEGWGLPDALEQETAPTARTAEVAEPAPIARPARRPPPAPKVDEDRTIIEVEPKKPGESGEVDDGWIDGLLADEKDLD